MDVFFIAVFVVGFAAALRRSKVVGFSDRWVDEINVVDVRVQRVVMGTGLVVENLIGEICSKRDIFLVGIDPWGSETRVKQR